MNLQGRIEDLHKKASGKGDDAVYARKGLEALARAVSSKQKIFGIEPWHPLTPGAFISPGEYLLRLKNAAGEALPPYPMVMYFYENGLTAELDTILFLCALAQFKEDSEKQVTVNISARSLAHGDFIKTVLAEMEKMGLAPNSAEKIIFEIHESTGNVKMSMAVLEAMKKLGMGFAIDDVGLSLDNVFRLSSFDGIADFVKIDRKSVCAHPAEPYALQHVMSFMRSLLPGAVAVAEGVQSPEHALQIVTDFPEICYAQGLYLPGRAEFAHAYEGLRGQGKTAAK